jgi:hypothetical protein
MGLAAALVALIAAQPVNALAAKADCRAKNPAGLSSWSGVWMAEGAESGLNGRPRLAAIVTLSAFGAPWNDEGWSRVESALRVTAKTGRKEAGWAFPMMMAGLSPFKFVIAPAETVIANQYRDIRYVYTDGRRHPPERDRWPNPWGDSIGCWTGRALVIETTDLKFSPSFNYIGPPLSDRAVSVERLQAVAPGRIESDITITDPVTLERPWKVKVAYVHPKGIDRIVHDGDTFENDRTDSAGAITPPRQPVSLSTASVKPDAQLSEAELDRVAGEYALDGTSVKLQVERRGTKLFFTMPLPFWTRWHARGPLDFEFADAQLHFTTDARGSVTGFTGTQADGMAISGKRIASRP